MIDTTAWTHALRRQGDVNIRARVQQLLNDQSAVWCEMVRLELWGGVRDLSERRVMETLDKTLPRLPITSAVWNAAAIYGSKARHRAYRSCGRFADFCLRKGIRNRNRAFRSRLRVA